MNQNLENENIIGEEILKDSGCYCAKFAEKQKKYFS